MPRISDEGGDVVILISAKAEWTAVMQYFHLPPVESSPFGDFFQMQLGNREAVLFHGGWGKIAAAASAQYVIDRWQPYLVINLGTCGGLEDKTRVGEILLVDKTLVYDIYERMGDPAQAIAQYTTQIDLSYLSEPFPQVVRRSLLVSADQDIDPDLVHKLVDDFGAVAADWESGAIAWTAHMNEVPCLILRAVSDLVDPLGGEIYESEEFKDRAESVMLPLLRALPNWIRCAFWGLKQ
jgi:adenosylhomocysteine nucleosidase